MLIRLQKNDSINYSEFPDMLYNVRFEIAMSEMMESNINDFHYNLRQNLLQFDVLKIGKITAQECQEALRVCKKLNVTPF